MRTPQTGLTSRRLGRTLALAVVMALLAAIAAVFVSQQISSAEPADNARTRSYSLSAGSHGVGMNIDGQYVGTWKVRGTRGFCIEFNAGHPNSSGQLTVPGRLPGMTAEESRRVKYVANRYATSTSKTVTTAAAFYVWRTEGTSRFKAWYKKLIKQKKIPKAVLTTLARITAEAQDHGPYTLTMRQSSGLPGQTINGVVTVRAANRKVAANMPVRFTINTNGRLVRVAKTSNSKGQVAFSAKVTRLGPVRVDASLSTKALGGAWMTRPSAGKQKLILAGTSYEVAKAYSTSLRRFGAPTLRSACNGDCKGAAPVRLSFTNVRGAATLRQFIFVNGKRVSHVDIAGTGRAVTKSVTAPDLAVVTSSFCVLTRNAKGQLACIGSPQANPGKLTVECPPMVEFRYSGTCPCGGAKNVTYELLAPVAASSKRVYVATLKLNGKNLAPVTLKNGTWTKIPTVKLNKNDNTLLSVKVLGKTYQLDGLTRTQ